jgi:hypothetical protein
MSSDRKIHQLFKSFMFELKEFYPAINSSKILYYLDTNNIMKKYQLEHIQEYIFIVYQHRCIKIKWPRYLFSTNPFVSCVSIVVILPPKKLDTLH